LIGSAAYIRSRGGEGGKGSSIGSRISRVRKNDKGMEEREACSPKKGGRKAKKNKLKKKEGNGRKWKIYAAAAAAAAG
jgi:hypothetical protein